MRLFIAIDMPDAVTRELGALQDSGLDVSWSSPETMHLTLRFIGEVETQAQKERLVEELTLISQPAFTLSLKGLGYFPQEKQPKVLWAGVVPNPHLNDLQEAVEQACRAAGFDSESREFHPHITLGRIGNMSKKEVNSFINQHKSIQFFDIPIQQFTLFKSKLKPGGALHTPLEKFGLVRQKT